MTLHSAKGGSGERGLDDDSRLAGMDGTTPQNGTGAEREREMERRLAFKRKRTLVDASREDVTFPLDIDESI